MVQAATERLEELSRPGDEIGSRALEMADWPCRVAVGRGATPNGIENMIGGGLWGVCFVQRRVAMALVRIRDESQTGAVWGPPGHGRLEGRGGRTVREGRPFFPWFPVLLPTFVGEKKRLAKLKTDSPRARGLAASATLAQARERRRRPSWREKVVAVDEAASRGGGKREEGAAHVGCTTQRRMTAQG